MPEGAMIDRIRKSGQVLCLAGAVFGALIANAQGAPATSTGAAAFVNGAVISNYDLDQRTALFLATSGARPTEESLPQIRAQVLRSLEDEMIQMQEASKHHIGVSKSEVDKAILSIATDNRITVPQLMNTIAQAGVTPQTFGQQVSAQLIWQKVVTGRYGTDVLISDQDIDEAMERAKQ